MAGAVCEESAAGRSMEGLSSGQHYQSGEVMTEWRSSEQVENGTPSTSPPYWDTDDDGGPKPSDLYGKYTWRIEKFSTLSKRELKSNAFEVGGYKWYILIYPQGCDVSNHLSLFLCVADHDKLLPGWSHFAQFTIAVVNKDPKKSKYSDTLHRFWKKEHDWGWKKFMELSKVSDGFVDGDTLIIKAQVQVIREKADHPFRCLDCQYRRELVRVYLTNVEQICRRFVDDRRGKLGKLLEDKARWSSFCAFWLGIDQSSRHCMSREKMDSILKMVVKHFFIEKEVTSTLVMDSMYSGLKALEGQIKCVVSNAKFLEGEDVAAPVVRVEKDMFVLVDDVPLLLERATMEPLPPKDEKGPQNRTKDGGAGEDFHRDSIDRDERLLTELGRRTVEIFVLTHIFSKIEAAYQEVVALKRQEELIREEKAESEQRAKRGMAEKEKRSKKKQGKQKRNNRKTKDKVKGEMPGWGLEDKLHENPIVEVKDTSEGQTMLDKDDTPEDRSDLSDSVECPADILQPDSEDRDVSVLKSDTDTSEVRLPAEANGNAVGNGMSSLHHGGDKRSSSVMDDSFSTCSTDSTPSLVMNGSCRGNSPINNKSQKSPTRGKNQRPKVTDSEASGSNKATSLTSEPVLDLWHQNHTPSVKAGESIESEAVVLSLKDPVKRPEPTIVKKEEEVILLKRQQSSKSQVESDKQPKEKASPVSDSPKSPPSSTISTVHPDSGPKSNPLVDLTPARKITCNTLQHTDSAASAISASQRSSISKLDSVNTPIPAEKPSAQQAASLISRPSSTPLTHGSNPSVPLIQTARTAPLLSQSVNATGHLDPDSSPANHNYAFQSYRNAILANVVADGSPSFSHAPPPSPSSAVKPSLSSSSSPLPSPSPSPLPSFSHPSTLVPGPIFVPWSAEMAEMSSVNSGVFYNADARGLVVQSARQQWLDSPQREAASRSIKSFDRSSMHNEIRNEQSRLMDIGSLERFRSDFSVSTSRREPTQGGHWPDEFPHLDIINDLLDDEQNLGSELSPPNQRFSFPADMNMLGDLGSSTGSCRFERSQSYHEDMFRSDYGFPGNHYETLQEYIPHSNIMPSMNGQIEGLVQNQWEVAGHDLSMLSMRNSGIGDEYLYGIPEFSNLSCGLDGYTMFRS